MGNIGLWIGRIPKEQLTNIRMELQFCRFFIHYWRGALAIPNIRTSLFGGDSGKKYGDNNKDQPTGNQQTQ